jgi:hypothetical protein
MVAAGLMAADDPQLKDMLAALMAQRAAMRDEVALLEVGIKVGFRTIEPERLEGFVRLLRTALSSGDPAFRKAYLSL